MCIGALCALAGYGMAWLDPALAAMAAGCMAAAIVITMPSALLLGAQPSRRHRWLRIAAGSLALLLLTVLTLALALPSLGGAESLILGLPRRLALVIYGVGLVPFLFLPIAFASDFDTASLDPDALRDLRARCAALRGEQ